MGCLTRLGCVAVVGVAAVGAGWWWLNGGTFPTSWTSSRAGAVAARDSLQWASLEDASSGSTEAIAALRRRNGPAYVTLSAGDVAGFLATALARALPRSAADPQVAVEGNRLHLRALLNMRDLAGEGALGTALGITLGRALSERDTLHIAGTVSMLRPGIAQYHVSKLAVRSIDVPPRLIPQLVRSLRGRVELPEGLADDALPIQLPPEIGDIRIGGGTITLYR